MILYELFQEEYVMFILISLKIRASLTPHAQFFWAVLQSMRRGFGQVQGYVIHVQVFAFIFFFSSSINIKSWINFFSWISPIFSELVRTNELCRKYSEACIELCQEIGVKVVDLFSALQKRSDWTTACFT